MLINKFSVIIIELKEREELLEKVKRNRVYVHFQKLLSELRKKELPHEIIESINQDIEDINSMSSTGNELRKSVKQKHTKIMSLLEKELKIVPRQHYLNQMLVVVSTVAVFLSLILQMFMEQMMSMGIIGAVGVLIIAIGIIIFVPIGIGIGSRKDKKAFKEGKQLDLKG